MGVYGITGKELSSVVEEAGNKFFRLGLTVKQTVYGQPEVL